MTAGARKPYVTETMDSTPQLFQSLVEIVAKLRGPQGCPWDKEQTARSLTPFILEEAFELVEAIEGGRREEIIDELGDFLFQVVLQAQVAKDEGAFTIDEVVRHLAEKMVRRHPHVFGDQSWATSDEVLANWDALKEKEKKRKIFNYPRNLPALQAAHKIGFKSEGWKFDWDTAAEVLAKVDEEIAELKEAMQGRDEAHLRHEMGDALFSLAQLARHLGFSAEESLREANRRFETRFDKMLELREITEKAAFAALSPAEKERAWAAAKAALAGATGQSG